MISNLHSVDGSLLSLPLNTESLIKLDTIIDLSYNDCVNEAENYIKLAKEKGKDFDRNLANNDTICSHINNLRYLQ